MREGEKHHSFFLIWIDPPEIVSIPSPQEDLYEGNGTVLFCNVTGNPQPNISWTKQGNDSVLSTVQTLKPTVLKRVDDGAVYKCKVQNYLGLMETTVMISVLCKWWLHIIFKHALWLIRTFLQSRYAFCAEGKVRNSFKKSQIFLCWPCQWKVRWSPDEWNPDKGVPFLHWDGCSLFTWLRQVG